MTFRISPSIFKHYINDIRFIADQIISKLVAMSDIKLHYNHLVFNRNSQFKFIQDYSSFLQTTSDAFACKSIIDGVDLTGDEQIKKKVASSILDALENGKKASSGMIGWFDNDILDLYKAGESSGDIKKVLEIFVQQEKNLKDFKSQFAVKFVSPGYMLISGIISAIYLGSSEFMGFANIVPVDKWGEISQTAYYLSKFFAGNWITILSVFLLGIFTWKEVAVKYTGIYRGQLDKWPPFNIYKAFQALSVIKLIAIIKSTMAGDNKAILVAHENSNSYVRTFTKEMLDKLEKGETQLARAVDAGLFPPRLMSRLYSVSRIPNDESKNRALLLVTEQAEGEAKLQLSKTQFWLVALAWLMGMAVTGTIMIGFALVIFNLKNFLTS